MLKKEVICPETVDSEILTFFKKEINQNSTMKFYSSKLNKKSNNGIQVFYYDCSQNRSHIRCQCKIYVIYNYKTGTGDIYRSLETHNHS